MLSQSIVLYFLDIQKRTIRYIQYVRKTSLLVKNYIIMIIMISPQESGLTNAQTNIKKYAKPEISN
jgi:hypothetical protein